MEILYEGCTTILVGLSIKEETPVLPRSLYIQPQVVSTKALYIH